MHSPARHPRHPVRGACALLLLSCSSFQTALAPTAPRVGDDTVPVQVPDSLLREAVRHGDLIVLATPVEMKGELERVMRLAERRDR